MSGADTGSGIDRDHSDRLFNPLFTTKSGGMGMGLSICRAIIEAHDGQLSFAPNSPRGAVFRFSLHAGLPASLAASVSARGSGERPPVARAAPPS